ncbi:MAG: tetratricopeptide repeat protein [Candidatus Omnitrophota bacterium]
MKPGLMKYNPAFLSSQELTESFVVRQVDLEFIIETIKENTRNSNQHMLIIGPRGMGKTTLVLRAVESMATDPDLNAQWYPIVFSEESYEISTPAELWLKAVFHLGKQTKSENLVETHDRLKSERDEKRLYERALSCLMDFSDQQGKRLLLVIENIDMLFNDQISPDESWDIRHTLLNEPRIMVLGTATSRFDGIDNVGRAMFDLFKIHQLEPLDTQDSKILWVHITGEAVSENKIRPIHILTGGNPRLLTIISSFAVGTSFQELMKQLTYLIDEYTTYFKSNIEVFPALERKIFVILAGIWEPADAARVAHEARIDSNKASSILKRLEARGCVGVLKSEGRKKSYQVTERLYNIYHLMRLSGSQSDRVRAVVDFMINFYEDEALSKKMAEIIEEARSLPPEERKDHVQAYSEILKKVQDRKILTQITSSTTRDFLSLPEVLEPIQKSILDDKPKGSKDWLNYGMILNEIYKKPDEAENAFRKAIEMDPESADAWAYLGILYEKTKKYEEAERAYQKALEMDPQEWIWKILLRLQLEQLDTPDNIWGTLKQGLKHKFPSSLNLVARMMFESNFKEVFTEAEGMAKEAIEKEPNVGAYKHTYASILGARGKWKKALVIASEFLIDSQLAKESPNDIISFFIGAAAAGHAKEGLRILKNSPCAPYMEPLIVALQMRVSEDYNAPQEVVEVAKDVLERIRQKKKKTKKRL